MTDMQSGTTAAAKQPKVFPPTCSVVSSLKHLRTYAAPATWIWLLTCLVTSATVLLHHADISPAAHSWLLTFFTAQFVFWRVAYDGLIGLILRYQSNGRRFERQVESGLRRWPAAGALLSSGVTFEDPRQKPFAVGQYSPAMTAWVVFRCIVNIVRTNDFLAYLVFVWAHAVPADVVSLRGFADLLWNAVLPPTFADAAMNLIGMALVGFALWSNIDAHRVLGDYAWYWGDFFFLKDQTLTFDGVFELVPHPMYTAGYSFMYGFALLSRSHTVFYWSVFAQVCQIAFLSLVETPHIAKTYRGDVAAAVSTEEPHHDLLYDEEQGFFDKRELVLLRNWNFSRGSDLLLFVLMGYATTAFAMSEGLTGVFAQYACWRLFLNGVLGWCLRQQSESQAWVKRLRGTPRRAFDTWKLIYNTAVTMANYSYVLCAIRVFQFDSLHSDQRWTAMIAGGLLVAINVWSTLSVYDAIGDFGFYYGDFFIENYPARLQHGGVYRYLNNPDSVLGCAWYYGLALIAFSPELFLLALFTHVCVKLFEIFVEAPHMRRRYGDQLPQDAAKALSRFSEARPTDQHDAHRRQQARRVFEESMAELREKADRQLKLYERSMSALMDDDDAVSSPSPATPTSAAQASLTDKTKVTDDSSTRQPRRMSMQG
jgi:phosphatidylethanolamine N-methyltransferase